MPCSGLPSKNSTSAVARSSTASRADRMLILRNERFCDNANARINTHDPVARQARASELIARGDGYVCVFITAILL